MAKPSSKIDWTVGNGSPGTVRVEPSALIKQEGWAASQRPPAQTMNWLLFNLLEWQDYFELITDGLIALQSTYDVVIGVNGTHATLNDAIADTGLGENVRVLVYDAATLTATQVLSKNGWVIDFKPSAIYAQGAVTSPGIQVTAERVKISGARFIDFNGGTDKAIELSAATKNCVVKDCSFYNCDVEIDDLGTNNALINNLTEV